MEAASAHGVQVLLAPGVRAGAGRTAALGEVGHAGLRWIRFGRALEPGAPVPPGAYVVGEQPWWELPRWDETVRAAPGLRAQLRRAARDGIRVQSHAWDAFTGETPLRRELSSLVQRWLSSRGLPALGFAAEVAPFAGPVGRRAFVARVDGRAVAVAFAAPLEEGSAWMLDVLARAPGAPNGTSELLVDAVFRAALADGISRATLGLCPLSGPVPPEYALVAKLAAPLYDFEGLRAFRARLRPHAWERVLLEHPGQSRTGGTLRALRAFAGGSLLRFVFRALLHRRAPP
jgi:phosphatidylglycerol lysyltransferase